jgi:hypothetical protein
VQNCLLDQQTAGAKNEHKMIKDLRKRHLEISRDSQARLKRKNSGNLNSSYRGKIVHGLFMCGIGILL